MILIIRLLLAFLIVLPAFAVRAADMPMAAGSPLVGVSFDDQPLILPVQRNFQMALLTVSSELGRSCGKMEAYGWRVKQSEQQRVDGIFSNTVGRLRGLGYTVEAQSPSTVSRDVTIFTADSASKHFTFMWSAGEIGLAMVLCENPRGSNVHSGAMARQAPSVETFTNSDLMGYSSSELPAPRGGHKHASKFSPVGAWSGSYTCSQGYTGGTLQISSLRGQNFQGVFRFYPTPRNPSVPAGSYHVYGQYDAESGRALINPGKWIQRPPHFYNTIMVGSFDPLQRSFSAYFQGITGCTSFEAKYGGPGVNDLSAKTIKKKAAKKKKHAAKKKTVKKPVAAAPAPAAAVPQPAPALQPAPGIDLSAPAAPSAPQPAPAAPSATPPSPVTAPETVPPPPAAAPAANEGTALPAPPPMAAPQGNSAPVAPVSPMLQPPLPGQ